MVGGLLIHQMMQNVFDSFKYHIFLHANVVMYIFIFLLFWIVEIIKIHLLCIYGA